MEADERNNFVETITDKSVDFRRWYTDVIIAAQLADYSPIKGCMVIRPYGYALWENMKTLLDAKIKDTGHENAYFPLFVPESLLAKEAEHIEGFAPEVAWVTHAGKEKLEERLAIRPTSEAIIGSMYAKWIDSWRDLPVLINQWANVVRWEKVTRPFLRTTEFLWQEGHTVHRTEEDAEEETLKMLHVYKDFIEKDLAIPVYIGRKTEREKFAGALKTYSLEALMSDGKALQAGTSHNLGQHFAKVFDITFQDMDGERKFAWQTSWGVSTRLIGALIMVHGDDSGLILPPRIAPIQTVVVPILGKKESEEAVEEKVREIEKMLTGVCRLKVDRRREHRVGWKFSEWELRGVPLRIEIGPKDVQKNQVVLVRRDTHAKEFIPIDKLKNKIIEVLDDIQKSLFEKAKSFRNENTRETSSFEELTSLIENKQGFVKAFWCGDQDCEVKIKEKTMATIRCIPFNEKKGRCILCGKTGSMVYFAKAY
ncbi:proline--tRNA ligase [Candidatus Oleimmundimicrobium sp.]|uniref:proline--tRNA ligase n=1 Tax=Candidatus Oleimmundimicrobium sp. TaxID=3060597 RepID=UPI002720CA89|nr:proline--tRNA ligase [Candidatus Oleimmundimicrobium sp.]MDO8885454.1 proline--tRNA ligase [Candidatus Oleimmundimicrobium sp.]